MSANPAWHDPAHPIAVEFTAPTLEQIRRLAFDGLLSLPRVGLGVGGFLLGTRERSGLLIAAFIPVGCSHTTGPSFDPTDAEVAAANHSPLPAGLEIIGCYCSRPRRPIELTDKDRNLFQRLCPGADSLYLLIRPSATEPTRAALFYRNIDGTTVGGVEHPIHPIDLPTEPVAAPAPVAPAVEAAGSFPEPELEPESDPEPEPDQEPEPEPEPDPVLFIPAPKGSKPNLFGEPAPLYPPAPPPQSRLFSRRIVGSVVATSVFLAATWLTRDQWYPRPDLELHAAEVNGHFSLEWNRAAVRGLNGGQLTVTEGTSSQSIPLDRRQLEAGAIPWTRHSPEVTAVLVAGAARASAKFVAPPAPPLPAALANPDTPLPASTVANPPRSK